MNQTNNLNFKQNNLIINNHLKRIREKHTHVVLNSVTFLNASTKIATDMASTKI